MTECLPCDTSEVLNRLLTILCRSLPMYLRYAPPEMVEGRDRELAVLESIRAEQESLGRRISCAIGQSGGMARLGDFPMQYTDLHDLDLDFMSRLLADYQKQDVTAIEECVEQLQMAPAALALAEEALGLAQGHLEMLQA